MKTELKNRWMSISITLACEQARQWLTFELHAKWKSGKKSLLCFPAPLRAGGVMWLSWHQLSLGGEPKYFKSIKKLEKTCKEFLLILNRKSSKSTILNEEMIIFTLARNAVGLVDTAFRRCKEAERAIGKNEFLSWRFRWRFKKNGLNRQFLDVQYRRIS